MSNEVKINPQESIKKTDLTREKEIPQSFQHRENKAEGGERFFSSKKRKSEVQACQNYGVSAHTMGRRKTCVCHLTKKPFCIYREKEEYQEMEKYEPSQMIIFLYSSKIWTTKEQKGQLTSSD